MAISHRHISVQFHSTDELVSHSLTHSLTDSLTHPAYSLTHSLITHSLTHSLTWVYSLNDSPTHSPNYLYYGSLTSAPRDRNPFTSATFHLSQAV